MERTPAPPVLTRSPARSLPLMPPVPPRMGMPPMGMPPGFPPGFMVSRPPGMPPSMAMPPGMGPPPGMFGQMPPTSRGDVKTET